MTDHSPQTLTRRLLDQALALGFDAAAVAPAGPMPAHEALTTWLAEGRHGELGYMARHAALRADARAPEPGMRSAIVVLKNYRQPLDLLPGGARIARYAHGLDYHDVLRERLQRLASFVHAEAGATVATRPATDSAPYMERDLARLAGLGWVGKNTMMIHPKLGSFTFIAELLVDVALSYDATPAPDRCGRCTRCLDVCPTGALVSPGVLDARRCISYLTIELRGPIPRQLRPLIHDYLFGCDLCQDVCPWNRRAPLSHDPVFAPTDATRALSPEAILTLDAQDFNRTFRGSPVQRTKRRGLLRNAAVVLGNRHDPHLIPLLSERLSREPEPLVRGHIAWALGQLEHPDADAALRAQRAREVEPYVCEELRHALRSHDDPSRHEPDDGPLPLF